MIDNYLNFAKDLRNLQDMRVTVIPVVIGEHRTIFKVLERGLEDLEFGVRIVTI